MVQNVRIAGKFERRPKATPNAIGNAITIDNDDSKIVNGRPPQRSVSTLLRPNTLPYMRVKKSASTTTHKIASAGRQNARMQLQINSASINNVATKGRHCSSKG